MLRNSFRYVFIVFMTIVISVIFQTCSKDDTPTDPGTPVDQDVSDKIRPVVFVHGIMAAANAWTPAIEIFRLNGYPSNYLRAFDFTNYMSTGVPDVAAMASQLEAFVTKVSQETGFPRVDIIAHALGVQVVQYFITKKNGVNKVAHVVACAGAIDNNLTLNGSLTPTPVKYRTIRSDGSDATQAGDERKGSMTGADNQQFPGLDHQQVISNINSIKLMYAFCTGAQVKKTDPGLGITPFIGGKVIDFVDNTPVKGATVLVYNVNPTNGSRLLPLLYQTTTDQDGNWGPRAITRGLNKEIYVSASNYYDAHYYRIDFRDTSFTERIKMIPKTGGSVMLQAFRSALTFGPNHAMVILFSPNKALYNGRNTATVNGVDVINANTAPSPGSSVSGSNTVSIICFDEKSDQQTTTGPMANPVLNTFAINSFDIFIPAVPAGTEVPVVLDGSILYARNWRSEGTSTDKGFSVVQFE